MERFIRAAVALFSVAGRNPFPGDDDNSFAENFGQCPPTSFINTTTVLLL